MTLPSLYILYKLFSPHQISHRSSPRRRSLRGSEFPSSFLGLSHLHTPPSLSLLSLSQFYVSISVSILCIYLYIYLSVFISNLYIYTERHLCLFPNLYLDVYIATCLKQTSLALTHNTHVSTYIILRSNGRIFLITV